MQDYALPYFKCNICQKKFKVPSMEFSWENSLTLNMEVENTVGVPDVLATSYRFSLGATFTTGKTNKPIKILGDGKLEGAYTVKANAFSKSAKEKIEAAGGKAEVI